MNTDNGRKTDLAQRPLSFTEAVFLADNLETIDYFRDLQRRNKQQPHNVTYASMSLVGKLLLAVVWAALIYGFGSLALAVIQVLFI